MKRNQQSAIPTTHSKLAGVFGLAMSGVEKPPADTQVLVALNMWVLGLIEHIYGKRSLLIVDQNPSVWHLNLANSIFLLKKISGKPIKTVFTKHMRRFLYIHYVYRYTITQITWGTLLNLMHIHIWKTLIVAIVMAPRSTIQERAVTPIYANTCIFVQVFSINITNLGR